MGIRILSPQSGVHSHPPCVLKMCKNSAHLSLGDRNTSLAAVPQVSVGLVLPRRLPLFFFLSPFHSSNNRPGQSFGLLHIPCQKQKSFLTPDDQACSRSVWYVASAWSWGGMHASNLYSGMPASGAGGENAP